MMPDGDCKHDRTDNLDRRLRDCAPDCRPDDDHRHRLRMQLDHNFRYHRTRARLLPAAILILAVVLGALQLTDVGSGSFRLDLTDKLVGDRAVLESPLGNFRITDTEPGRTPSSDQREQLESLYESVESGQGRLVGGTGWTIKGHTMLFLNYEHTLNGKVETLTECPVAPDRKASLEIWRFLQADKEAFLSKVAAGTVPKAGTVEWDILGHTILFSTWTTNYPGWGDVTYWEYISHR